MTLTPGLHHLTQATANAHLRPAVKWTHDHTGGGHGKPDTTTASYAGTTPPTDGRPTIAGNHVHGREMGKTGTSGVYVLSNAH